MAPFGEGDFEPASPTSQLYDLEQTLKPARHCFLPCWVGTLASLSQCLGGLK